MNFFQLIHNSKKFNIYVFLIVSLFLIALNHFTQKISEDICLTVSDLQLKPELRWFTVTGSNKYISTNYAISKVKCLVICLKHTLSCL